MTYDKFAVQTRRFFSFFLLPVSFALTTFYFVFFMFSSFLRSFAWPACSFDSKANSNTYPFGFFYTNTYVNKLNTNTNATHQKKIEPISIGDV